MAAREDSEATELRFAKLKMLQNHYKSFNVFLVDFMRHLGFGTSWLQQDIGNYLEHGPDYLMVQAQRGQAKTTITAAYAVWSLIQKPDHRILIVSAAGEQAGDISILIVRVVMTMEQLECMRPDKTQGDRTSTENFDIHYALKGVDKSASVCSIGIGGTLVGKRADLLIADDVESPKNSTTATEREKLLQLTREFTSINADGRIVYLGTPQSMDSIYNSLPARGFQVRIWPGRYPTPEQLPNYADNLAPSIVARMKTNVSLTMGGGLLGDQGQPTDPELNNEDKLIKKEMDQGKAHFQLQFMLSTALNDALRYPLKPQNLIVMRLGNGKSLPMSLTRSMGEGGMKDFLVHSYKFRMATPHAVSEAVAPPQGIMMYVDPAGGGANADETAYAVSAFLNGNIYILDVGGVPGGYSQSVLEALAAVAAKWQCNTVAIEKNFGYGAFAAVWTPVLRTVWQGSIEEDMVTGAKERRIINTLEPIMGRGSLIINEDCVESDQLTSSKYDAAKRITYSLFHQMGKLTHAAGSLAHDDRLDALEGACRYWVKYLGIDETSAEAKAAKEQMKKLLADPMGKHRYSSSGPSQASTTLNRFRRF